MIDRVQRRNALVNKLCVKSVRILMSKRDADAFGICLSKALQIISGESVLIWLKVVGWLVALAQKLPVHEAHYCCQMLEWKDSNFKNATKPFLFSTEEHLRLWEKMQDHQLGKF